MTPGLGSEDKRTNGGGGGAFQRDCTSIHSTNGCFIYSINSSLNNFSLDKKTETDIKVDRTRNR